MTEFESTSSFLEYDNKLFDPNFVYTPTVPPIIILLSHQIFTQVSKNNIQKIYLKLNMEQSCHRWNISKF